MGEFSDYNELRLYLKSLTPDKILRYRENARDYLASTGFLPYSRETFVDTIVSALEKDSGATIR